MRFQTSLVPGRLVRRYKRFLADVTLEDGREVVAHCPNPGSMMGLAEPGSRVWLEPNDDPKKKLKYGWRLVETASGALVGIDTGAANRIAEMALRDGQIAELAGFDDLRREVRYGDGNRVDFLATYGAAELLIEVKSVTLSRQLGLAEFPDSVTARGAKHLTALSAEVAAGRRALLLYLVQRGDCQKVCAADDIDPTYAAALARARQQGVEVLAYDTDITQETITVRRRVPVEDMGAEDEL